MCRNRTGYERLSNRGDEEMIPIQFFLGLCIGYVPGNLDLSNEICFAEVEARNRIIEVKTNYDDFEREYFEWQVSQVVWPKN